MPAPSAEPPSDSDGGSGGPTYRRSLRRVRAGAAGAAGDAGRTPYDLAFLAAAIVAIGAVPVALSIRDSDAAETMRRRRVLQKSRA